MPNLMWLLAIPFSASIAAFICPSLSPKNFKRAGVTLSLLPLALLLYGHNGWIGEEIDHAWVPALSIRFHLSVDALSLLFLYLTALLIPVSLLSVREKTLHHPQVFYGLVLLLQGLLFVFFTARDLAVFTVFWEAMLLPLYFIINLWGGIQRQAAALKFLIYMIAGSALMVAGVLLLYFASASAAVTGTFDLDALAHTAGATLHAEWICAIFLLAFAVKTPLFPFHAWLPDAYCQASTPGTILLAGLLSKAGIYGILRVGFELFPDIIKEWSPLLLPFAIAGVLYGGLAAWMQGDFKRLIAYSSFSHVNFILVGLFVWSQTAHAGAILQALNHGVTITGLFLTAGWLEERVRATSIETASGLTRYMPQLCWTTLLFVLSSAALPGTNNFVGEFMIFLSLFRESPWLTFVLGLSIILSVVYMLRWMQKMYFGPPSDRQISWIDIRAKEIAIAAPLIVLILWIGIYPAPVLKLVLPAADKTTASVKSEELK